MSEPSSSPLGAGAGVGFEPARLLAALGLPAPATGGGLPLARLDGGTGPSVTVAGALSAQALAVAAQRGTPLLVVVEPRAPSVDRVASPEPAPSSVLSAPGAAGGAVGYEIVGTAGARGRWWWRQLRRGP